MVKITRKVQKLSGTLHIGIPRDIADLLDIKKGDPLGIDLKKGKIIITPAETSPKTAAGATAPNAREDAA